MFSRDEVFSFIFLDVPSAPVNLTRTKTTKSSITIRWGAPKNTDNHEIFNFFLEIESPERTCTVVNYTALDNIRSHKEYEHTFNYLKHNTKYSVHVSAYNKLGRGARATKTYKTGEYTKPGWWYLKYPKC